jgi:general secretion pathway protein A
MSRNKRGTTTRALPSIVLTLACALAWPGIGWAQTHRAEQEHTAQNLATLLNVGRLVVERNQTLINDPRKGNKGFTPEAFEHQVVEEFLRQTAIDLNRLPSDLPSLAKTQLPLLLQSSKEVIADAQFVINQRGIGYKNFIPATFGSQAARKFSNRSHVKIKQTALNPRNLKNTPDAYEEQALKRLATQPAANTPITEWIDDGRTLRALTPIYYSQDCLVCHGDPKGMLDISGYLREGAREGDLAGAISIQIPLNNP